MALQVPGGPFLTPWAVGMCSSPELQRMQQNSIEFVNYLVAVRETVGPLTPISPIHSGEQESIFLGLYLLYFSMGEN